MKRAIYFDDDERELARRVLSYWTWDLSTGRSIESPAEKVCRLWTKKSIEDLLAKFDEPAPK